MPSPPLPGLPHGLRFAFGTLTVIPVRVTRWDREAARGGMLCAPAVGLVVGAGAAVIGLLLLFLGAGSLLASVAAAAVPAVLTRGLHLDGLADTADGLGSGKPAEDALRVMKQSDIGPFGVLTLVFTLFAQVAALAQAYDDSWARGTVAAVVSAVADRRPQRIVAHAATRDAAELVGRDLTEHGYRVECALLQSVGLDTRAWTETERSVAFLLSGVLPDRAP
ncbi:adenosylcobinamide-GDP ribazoletransferase [Streptomyces olivaceus]|uniref:adenosylcobinamide-GDP ribazoletransferase n=1 Tax=Streptomyces olivaceus TaxID=47716 RepID=UPI004057225B